MENLNKLQNSYSNLTLEDGPPEIDEKEIEIEEQIGAGSFGKVYKGKCRKKPVAIKILHKQNLDTNTLLAFRKEVSIMRKIFHPNICLFMGACTIGRWMIVTELLPKGDLESILRDKQNYPDSFLNNILKMKMARDAALGMNWLHSSNPVFIHRDLKTSNLLVDNNMSVKVCDFGLSQFISPSAKTKDKQNAKGTPLWMAPEVMMFQEFNEKCDIYSYGIVLWEILTRQEPFTEFDSFDIFKEAVCIKHVRPTIPDTVHSLKELIEDCWNFEPSKRPSFKDIIDRLGDIIIDYAIEDKLGKLFWKKNFHNKEEVLWLDFINKFLVFLELNEDNNETFDLKKQCLHAILIEASTNKNISNDMVHIDQFGRVLKWFGPLTISSKSDNNNNNNNILDKIYFILEKQWFHGDIDSLEAERRLAGRPPCTFLVRFSSSIPGTYTFSYVIQNDIKHRRVSYTIGKGFEYDQKYYDSIEDIVKYSKIFIIPCPGSKFQSLFVNNSEIKGHNYFGYSFSGQLI